MGWICKFEQLERTSLSHAGRAPTAPADVASGERMERRGERRSGPRFLGSFSLSSSLPFFIMPAAALRSAAPAQGLARRSAAAPVRPARAPLGVVATAKPSR